MNWQPIETAPTDGTEIFAFRLGDWFRNYAVVRYSNNYEEWIDIDGSEFIGLTHWMPLPEPPKE